MDIFEDEEDFNFFLHRLKENLFPESTKNAELKNKKVYERKLLPPNSFNLICYCLMPNHFHLVIEQLSDIPISKLIAKVCTGFSMYFNKKRDRVGPIFQDAFKAVCVENNEQLLWLSLYVHNNPLKAGITENLETYKWSSFNDYKTIENRNLCQKDLILQQFKSPESYLEYFTNPELRSKIYNNLIGIQDILLEEEGSPLLF